MKQSELNVCRLDCICRLDNSMLHSVDLPLNQCPDQTKQLPNQFKHPRSVIPNPHNFMVKLVTY